MARGQVDLSPGLKKQKRSLTKRIAWGSNWIPGAVGRLYHWLSYDLLGYMRMGYVVSELRMAIQLTWAVPK